MVNVKGKVLKISATVASLALLFGVATTQLACIFWFHQPKMPEGLKSK